MNSFKTDLKLYKLKNLGHSSSEAISLLKHYL